MTALLAQALFAGTVAHYAIALVVIAGVVGVVLVVARQSGVVVPGFVIQIAWILLAVVVGVLAVRFLMTL